jgi:predicted GH43/DUF377 family glycosyl hydrolase
MLLFKREGIVLQHTLLAFEQNAVMNPAVIKHQGQIHMFYRAVDMNGYSSIGYCKLSSPLAIDSRSNIPVLTGNTTAEAQGMEDPRIVCIDGLFFLSYTAFDGLNALGSLLFSYDLVHFFGKRILVAQQEIKKLQNQHKIAYRWDKNLVFFPRRINGEINFMHRIKPHILLTSVNEIMEVNDTFWSQNSLKVNTPIHLFSKEVGAKYVGAGCPPIETKAGWVLIYHAAYRIAEEIIYKVHVALLDLNNPSEVIAELPYPVLEPLTPYERYGNINNVVFPTAFIEMNDTVFVYYGAADTCIACASFSMSEMLQELFKHPKTVNYDA